MLSGYLNQSIILGICNLFVLVWSIVEGLVDCAHDKILLARKNGQKMKGLSLEASLQLSKSGNEDDGE